MYIYMMVVMHKETALARHLVHYCDQNKILTDCEESESRRGRKGDTDSDLALGNFDPVTDSSTPVTLSE